MTLPLAYPELTTVHSLRKLVGDRILTRLELEALVAAVSACPELWEPRIDRRSGQRTYASLHRDAHVDVWAIFWRPGNDTGWHDHDISSGAVHVVQGALTNCGLRVGALDRRRTHRAGESFSFDPTQIHRLVSETDTAISIHAYSAPLWRLGQYTVDADGALRRLSVSYADELRPLELSAAGANAGFEPAPAKHLPIARSDPGDQLTFTVTPSA